MQTTFFRHISIREPLIQTTSHDTARLWVLSNKPAEYQLHTVLSSRDVGATDRDFCLYS
ncbi:hypothetical protein LDENG_00242640 [Lucifuga dentata]|nr:hypothetical protein LDENG_00242640 [Lucifuga dentata]